MLLVTGGESPVRGAGSLARPLGMSSLVVGLTVVSFTTSAPEVAAGSPHAARWRWEVFDDGTVDTEALGIHVVVRLPERRS
ncbi:hypothetical protein [Nocardiopsis sp. FR6]|uniref:hypothetical protein n=1 Tax=Nocardiopsis sp. FR6 TaxID=2605986 RepID=UPI0019155F53|nr:hypothetical protein [Nocardiopsis sp. FR6]